MEEIKDMTPKLIGETWREYPTETSKQKATYGLFECPYCEKEFEAQVSDIKNGGTKSCGCLIGRAGTHLFYKRRFYRTWVNMRGRCVNPKDKAYKDYGGRGILVCEEWQDVTQFIEWAEATYIEGLTLDRIDNEGNYEPDNCRWVDRTIQSLNKRKPKNNTSGYVGINWVATNNKWAVRITVNGKRLSLGYFEILEEAVLARDTYIIENNLPHKLSTEY